MKINFWKAINVSATVAAVSITAGYAWKIASIRERDCGDAGGESVLEHMASSIDCESFLGFLSLMVRAPKLLAAVVALDASCLVMMCFGACRGGNQEVSLYNI